jgi:DNA-directed RNA polymerase II subunit RPB1
VRAGKVQFGLLSSEETRKLSTVQIKDTTIYYRGLPNPYGINDHRMGTVDRRLLCGTCCRDVKECQGHVGHIELAFPMLHIGFFDTCFKTLRCVCFACSRVMLTASEIHALQQSRVEGKLRFQAAYGFIKGRKRCHECSMTQPQYTRTPLGIRCDWAADTPWMSEEERAYCTQPFTQRDVLSILNHITTADAELLGFNEFCHPRSFVLTTILVPPPVARPAIMASEGSRSRGQDGAQPPLSPAPFPPLTREYLSRHTAQISPTSCRTSASGRTSSSRPWARKARGETSPSRPSSSNASIACSSRSLRT